MPRSNATATATATATTTAPAEVAAEVAPGSPPSSSGRRRRPSPVVEAAPAPTAKPSRSRARQPRPVVPVALGSLTQPGSRSGEGCARCGSARTTSLSMTLTDGTAVLFRSCHACEYRTWTSAEGELDREAVLDRTRKIR